MYVIKRNGQHAPFHFDEITSTIEPLCEGLPGVLPEMVTQRVVPSMRSGMRTDDISKLAAETAAALSTRHPDYATLAGRIQVQRIQKQAPARFTDAARLLRDRMQPEYNLIVDLHGELLDARCAASAHLDNTYDVFAVATLEKSYLLRQTPEQAGAVGREQADLPILETIQYMNMRIAIGVNLEQPVADSGPDRDLDVADHGPHEHREHHGHQHQHREHHGHHGHHGHQGHQRPAVDRAAQLERILETYYLLAHKLYTHATPTMFNAGTLFSQLSSCYLVNMAEDSIDGIYLTLARCAKISKFAGGLGISVHKVRAEGTYIDGTGGASNGLVPMLRVFNETARYVDQGGGKRKGAATIYLEPWHADIMKFLALRSNQGEQNERARDLNYALWIPDIFMERVLAEGSWPLFCPHRCPGLETSHGPEFRERFLRYEAEGRAVATLPARAVWDRVMQAQMETGEPYMLYKDHCNLKSNHSHLGTIQGSNLCTEIVQFTSPDETAVCNLASVNLAAMVTDGRLDLDRLARVVRVCTRNLNNVIDLNYYPIPSARRSNQRHRPIGIGVQGFADLLAKLAVPYASADARDIFGLLMEHIHAAALLESARLAAVHGPYPSFRGSPLSRGLLQADLWNLPRHQYPSETVSDRVRALVHPGVAIDWGRIRGEVLKYGARNSLLLAPMPTATTAQILGNTESFEPPTAMMFTRRVLAGDHLVVNRHLVRDLEAADLWDDAMADRIVAARGSVQTIPEIPAAIRERYRTVWEIPQRTVVDLVLRGAPFVCQSMSLNAHVESPTVAKLTSMHFYTWRNGLKTGSYYIRTQPKAHAIQFTVAPAGPPRAPCPVDQEAVCESCSA